MGFFSCCNKFLLIILNFAVFIIGTGIVILSSIVIHKSQVYKEMLVDSGMISLPIVVLIFGLLITMIGFFGCCGAVRENPCLLYTYATVVLCLFISGLVIGILILVYPSEAEELIKEPLKKVFNRYGKKDASLTKVIDTYQHEFKCCGIDSYKDWENFDFGAIPISCCKIMANSCDVNNPDELFREGCFEVAKEEVEEISTILGISCIVLAIVEFLCICIACGLAKKRSEYV